MKIKMLGTRGEIEMFHPKYRNHSGVLIDGIILLDAGEKKFLKHRPATILITHLHPDHAFFISRKDNIDPAFTIVAPETSKNCERIKVFRGLFTIGVYKITPIPVNHSLKVKSQGYLVEKNKTRIFYTGDIVDIDKKYWPLLYDLDLVITEASSFRKGGVVRKEAAGQKFGHAGVPDLVKFFGQFTSRIIFTHFGTWFIKNIKAGKKKIKGLETDHLSVDIAYDGAEFRL